MKPHHETAKTIHKYFDELNLFSLFFFIIFQHWNIEAMMTTTIAMVRFINKDGEKFVEQFLPEISTKFGGIIQDLLNRWIID